MKGPDRRMEDTGLDILRPPAPSARPRIGAGPSSRKADMSKETDELVQAQATLDEIPPAATTSVRTAAGTRAEVLVRMAAVRNDRERLNQERIANLLALASLNGEESELASAEAACLLLAGEPEVAVRLRQYCAALQVAAGNFHAPLTAGNVVNILDGREPEDDGPLLS